MFAHRDGICHVYLHGGADTEMAREVALNAKMRRTAVCGAAETLLVDRAATRLLPGVLADLIEAGLRSARRCCGAGDRCAREAGERGRLDDRISGRDHCREGPWTRLEEAIGHVNRYGSHHTDSIVTAETDAAEALPRRSRQRDRAAQRLDPVRRRRRVRHGRRGRHLDRPALRGPIEVEQLTNFKYVVRGNGQIRPV